MTLGPGWRRAFRFPFRTARGVEREVDDEIAFHLAMRAEKLKRLGVPEDRVQSEALARFGDTTRVRDECISIDTRFAREEGVVDWVQSLVSDVRYALRSLRLRPVFTLVAALTLALGIGATTAIFSLVDGILLRPLPYAHPDRIVRVLMSYPEKGLDSWVLSQENVAMFRDRTRDFAAFAGYSPRTVTMTRNGQPRSINATQASGEFFDVLGVRPLLGRVFGPADDTPAAAGVAVLGYGFWQSEFGGDRAIIGKTLEIEGQPVRVIGIMPRGFAFPRPNAQLYMPVQLDPTRRFGWFLVGLARLRDGATAASAERQTTAIMYDWATREPELLAAHPIDPRATRMRTLVVPLRTAITGDVARPLAILQAAVIAILLIAIANVATLMSSRASARGREIAVRTALGATRGRLVRQLLTESVSLALIGGVVGVALAIGGIRAFTHARLAALPRIGEVGVNWRVLLVALIAALASGLLFGIAPALHTMRRRVADGLSGTKESARNATRRLNSALVITQLALSVVLLIAAGLVLKSFRRLTAIDLGFDPTSVTAIYMPLPHDKYMGSKRIASTVDEVLTRVRAVPGVSDAAAAGNLPFSNHNSDGFLIEGRTPPANAGAETQTAEVPVTPNYFRTLSIRLEYGRDFSSADRDNTLPVAIVDEALASRYWKGADAIGKRMRFTGDTTWLTIVGVVASVRDQDAATEPMPHTYTPYTQSGGLRPTLAIRITGDPPATIASVRHAIASVEPAAPLDVRPLSDAVSQALDSRRLTEILLGGFAALALLLAAVGIYGVMSLYVAHRQREFGIRLAIGAAPARVQRLVLGEGLALAIVGVVIGTAVAGFATRWLRSILFEVSPTDPLVYSLLALLLLAVAFLSCYLPARRAARSDPLLALRAE